METRFVPWDLEVRVDRGGMHCVFRIRLTQALRLSDQVKCVRSGFLFAEGEFFSGGALVIYANGHLLCQPHLLSRHAQKFLNLGFD